MGRDAVAQAAHRRGDGLAQGAEVSLVVAGGEKVGTVITTPEGEKR